MKKERAPKRPSTFTSCKRLEGIADAQRRLRDICAALRTARRPIVVGGGFIVDQLARDRIQECLAIECVSDAKIDHCALEPGGAAGDPPGQRARSFPAASVLNRGAPWSAPARIPAEVPGGVLVTHSLRSGRLATLRVFQSCNIANQPM